MSVAIVIQHAKRMCCIILSSVASLVAPYFSTSSHKQHNFRKKVFEHKMCPFIFSTTFGSNVSPPKNDSQDIIINVHRCSRKATDILGGF